MLKKITELPIKAHIAFKGFVQDFKEDERGLSGVVVAVLLILVAVLAIAFLWTSLGVWLKGLWTKITTAGDGIEEL